MIESARKTMITALQINIKSHSARIIVTEKKLNTYLITGIKNALVILKAFYAFKNFMLN